MKKTILILTLIVLSFFGGAWLNPASWNLEPVKRVLRAWLAEENAQGLVVVEAEEDSSRSRRRHVPAAPIPSLVFESERPRFRSQANATNKDGQTNKDSDEELSSDSTFLASTESPDSLEQRATRNAPMIETETERPEPPLARAPTGPLARPDRERRDLDPAVTRTGGRVVMPDLADLERDARDTVGAPRSDSSSTLTDLEPNRSSSPASSPDSATPPPDLAGEPPTPDLDLERALRLPVQEKSSQPQPETASNDPNSPSPERDAWNDAVARLRALGVKRFGVETRLGDPKQEDHTGESTETDDSPTPGPPTMIAWAICAETNADGQPIRLEAEDETLQSALESLARKITLWKAARLADLDAP